ncbi:MAG TPA: DUF4197 domain-containing protein [Burkholderiales bacterium]|nr:DUF4197 domain-containing protein [Burkholderiales bacterium]
MLRILSIFVLAVITSSAFAQLSSISNTEASSGLKQALHDGSVAAVAKLGVENGFFTNPQVKIPLPPALKKVEGALRLAGMKKQADDLVLSMNRAAEQAVPEAKQLLADAVSKMSLQDAKGLLTGGQTSVTDYFRRTTSAQLTERFLPIVKKTTERVGLAQQYNSLAGQGASLGLIKKDQSTVEGYVTQKSLDGLYFMIGEQEKAFRTNPLGATSDIVKKVFGALK